MIDYYKVLGVPRDATEDAIKEAFRTRSKYDHPDMLPASAPQNIRDEWTTRYKLISQAYHVLVDTEQRGRYDRVPDIADMVQFGSELTSTLAAFRQKGEPGSSFARRVTWAAAKDLFRSMQTKDGQRKIEEIFTSVARKA